MQKLSVATDIIPIGDFKASIAKWFRAIQNSGHPLIITQNGKPAGVLLSPTEYDELVYKKAFLDSVYRGVADAEDGAVYSTEELKEELAKRKIGNNSHCGETL